MLSIDITRDNQTELCLRKHRLCLPLHVNVWTNSTDRFMHMTNNRTNETSGYTDECCTHRVSLSTPLRYMENNQCEIDDYDQQLYWGYHMTKVSQHSC